MMWLGQQTALIALFAVAALLPFVALTRSLAGSPLVRRSFALVLLLTPVACLVAAVFYRDRETDYQGLQDSRPIQLAGDSYTRSHSCKACHPSHHASWHDSYHRSMTQIASPETVLGDFDNKLLRFDEIDYFLSRDGDEYFVSVAQWGSFRGKVVLTTGSHHMQLYWYRTRVGRMLGLLPFVYLIPEQKWIPRHTAFLMPSDYHREVPTGRWNETCLRCHTTHPRPKALDVKNMQTEVAEFGIACEACHGPGEEHIRLNSNPLSRFRNRADGEEDASIVNPTRLDHRRSAQVCGLCHSATSSLGTEEDLAFYHKRGLRFRPGEALANSRHVIQLKTAADDGITHKLLQRDPELLRNAFWADGMVRVTGREYNGLIESPCYERGKLSCLNCHQMHRDRNDPRPAKVWADDQLKLEMRGNQACLQCHKEYGDTTQLQAHTHHAPNSSGSNCLNCHMPYTLYGLQKASRSHQISAPSVRESLTPESGDNLKKLTVSLASGEKRDVILEPRRQAGRPNACNQCHMDKSLSWTAKHLSDWYGQEAPPLHPEQQSYSAIALNALKGDAGLRALAAWNFAWPPARKAAGERWVAPYLAELLRDDYDAVRYIAHRSLVQLPGYDGFPFDYMGSKDVWLAGRKQALQIWRDQQQNQDRSKRVRGERILIDEDGRLRQDLIEQLLQQRDKRRISLAE